MEPLNKILLNNFPQPLQNVHGIDKYDEGKKLNFIHGFDIQVDFREANRELISHIISSPLIHEKICVNTAEFFHLIQLFGIDTVITLLRNETIEFIDDKGFGVIIKIKENELFEAASFDMYGTDGRKKNSLEVLEERLQCDKSLIKSQINNLILAAENHELLVNIDEIHQLLINELSYDLKNGNLTEAFEILSSNPKDIQQEDIYKVLT